MISKRMTWLLFAVFAIAGVVLFQMQRDRLFSNTGNLTVEQEGNTVVLYWRGEIAVPMAARFEEAFSEFENVTDHFVLDFASGGGSLSEGARVIRLITRQKHTHSIDTRVGDEQHCLSMCVPLYLQGENRMAAARSAWMFHEPAAYDFFDGSAVDQPEFEKRYFADRFFDTYFTRSPMKPAWRENLRREWVGREIWKTGSELVEEDSGIITELIR